jgi:hypothetical protein
MRNSETMYARWGPALWNLVTRTAARLPALRCTKVWQQRYASAHQLLGLSPVAQDSLEHIGAGDHFQKRSCKFGRRFVLMSRLSLQSGIIFRTHVEDKLLLVGVQAGSSSPRQLNLELAALNANTRGRRTDRSADLRCRLSLTGQLTNGFDDRRRKQTSRHFTSHSAVGTTTARNNYPAYTFQFIASLTNASILVDFNVKAEAKPSK